MSRVLVVDTDVARAAGETQHPISRACREALTTILDVCHRVALDHRASAEWRKHAAGFSVRWLAAMESKGKVRRLADSELILLNPHVEETPLTPQRRRAVLKDLHLIEAALAVDQAVLSMDESVRAALTDIVPHVPGLKDIVWVNPAKVEDDALAWLKAGARRNRARSLGAQAP
jgi:hypothetical protein